MQISGSHQSANLGVPAFSSEWQRSLTEMQLSLSERQAKSLLVTADSPTSTVPEEIARVSLISAATANGTPFAFRVESSELIQNVTISSASATSSVGKQALGFHTDFGPPTSGSWSHWDLRPETIILLGMEAPTNQAVITRIVAADELASMLSLSTIAALKESAFRFPVSYSMQPVPLDIRRWSMPGPIFVGNDGHLLCAADLPTVSMYFHDASIAGRICQSEKAQNALGDLLTALDQPHLGVSIELRAGSLLVFSNHSALHARSEYEPGTVGRRRMLRVYSTYDTYALLRRRDEIVQ
ncbi:TauD/TfdA family dioxygenase [Nocardia sp. MW-W600-9]